MYYLSLYAALEGKLFDRFPPNSSQTYKLDQQRMDANFLKRIHLLANKLQQIGFVSVQKRLSRFLSNLGQTYPVYGSLHYGFSRNSLIIAVRIFKQGDNKTFKNIFRNYSWVQNK